MTAPKKAPVLTVEDILSADDLSLITVDVKEWGGAVKIRPFTKRQQQQIRLAAQKQSQEGELDVDEFERLVFLAGVVEPEFNENQYNLLMEKSAQALDSVIKRVLEINGMSPEADAETAASFQG